MSFSGNGSCAGTMAPGGEHGEPRDHIIQYAASHVDMRGTGVAACQSNLRCRSDVDPVSMDGRRFCTVVLSRSRAPGVFPHHTRAATSCQSPHLRWVVLGSHCGDSSASPQAGRASTKAVALDLSSPA